MLKPEDIQQDGFLWLTDSIGNVPMRHCPAQIIAVDSEQRQFRIRYLDTMEERAEPFSFKVAVGSSHVRMSMQPATRAEVGAYLEKRSEKLRQDAEQAREDLRLAEEAATAANTAVMRFTAGRAALFSSAMA